MCKLSIRIVLTFFGAIFCTIFNITYRYNIMHIFLKYVKFSEFSECIGHVSKWQREKSRNLAFFRAKNPFANLLDLCAMSSEMRE